LVEFSRVVMNNSKPKPATSLSAKGRERRDVRDFRCLRGKRGGRGTEDQRKILLGLLSVNVFSFLSMSKLLLQDNGPAFGFGHPGHSIKSAGTKTERLICIIACVKS